MRSPPPRGPPRAVRGPEKPAPDKLGPAGGHGIARIRSPLLIAPGYPMAEGLPPHKRRGRRRVPSEVGLLWGLRLPRR